MLPVGVWRRELLELRVRRGSLLLGMVVPMAVALPLLGANPPALHAAAAYTTLAVLTGALVAGRRAAGLRREGLMGRLLATPASPYRLFVETLLAQVALDWVRVLPLLLAVAARYRCAPGAFGELLVAAVPALLLADLVGVAAAAAAGSRGEVPLYALVALLPLLFLAGAYTPAADSPLRAAVASVLPFTGLHRAMLAAVGGGPVPAPGPLLGGAAAAALAWLALGLLVLRRRLKRLE
ncbi:MAG TPA: ABC transporter permease [Candidatus Saccharimonadales bacterium]|nr:ABC transporter permease [Candidatus Saccharimonadales bacterium]